MTLGPWCLVKQGTYQHRNLYWELSCTATGVNDRGDFNFFHAMKPLMCIHFLVISGCTQGTIFRSCGRHSGWNLSLSPPHPYLLNPGGSQSTLPCLQKEGSKCQRNSSAQQAVKWLFRSTANILVIRSTTVILVQCLDFAFGTLSVTWSWV